MRIRVSQLLAVLAVLVLSCPVWARDGATTPMTFGNPVAIGHTLLQPGQYRFVANFNANRILVERDGQLIATIPAKAVVLGRRSKHTDVVLNGAHIYELRFAGENKALEVA
jgi:hypothetical protein